MTSPKDQNQADQAEALMNMRRAYTTGGKLGARQMFIFDADGNIAGLKKVEPASKKEDDIIISKGAKSDKDKKFGKLSSKMSVSAMSMAESKVAFSDANYMPEEGQDEGARIGNMRGKPGITIWNLLLVPGTLFFSLLSGADVMQSMTQILRDEDYYKLNKDDAGRVTANSLTYAQALAIPTVLVIGFLYDTIGRRAMTVGTFILGAISTMMIPVAAPSLAGYDAARIVFVQTLVVMLSNPFINDYVTVQSRGIATGFQTLGLTVGNLISVGGMFTLTEALDNKYIGYGILAAMQLLWAVLVYLMITEPNVRDEREAKHHNKKSFCGQLFSMLKQAYKACKQDHALLISLIGLIPSRNTANLQQSNFYIWISSAKFDLDEDVARSVWQKQNIISNCFALPMVFIIGRLSDRVSPKILVPSVLVFQIFVMGGYMFCSHPDNWYAYVLAAFQGGSGFIIIVAMQGYAAKRVPKMIRGIIMALIIALSGVGGIIYLQLSKIFLTTAPNMVFGLIGLFDAVILVFIVVMIAMGKYGDAAPQEDTFGEGNSQKQEGGTADFVKDHDFDDDIPDVPFSKDLYNEYIPEMSSHREESHASFHTKRQLGVSGNSRIYDDSDLASSRRGDNLIGTIRQSHAYAGGRQDMRNSYDTPLLQESRDNRSKLGSKISPNNDKGGKLIKSAVSDSMHEKDNSVQENIRMTFRDGLDRQNSTLQADSDCESDKGQKYTPVPAESVTRNTSVEKRKNMFKAKKKATFKRSSSFEKPQRQTLIQEMLQSHKIEEEQDEGDY